MNIYSTYKKITTPHRRVGIRCPDKGFTLIELMIVIAIIGVLAAIAIPTYARFQYQSKTSEAKKIIDSIKKTQIAYHSEHEVFFACASSPGANGTAGPSQRPWVDNGGFGTIGFAPVGDVRYNYSVAVSADGQEMAIEAEGDLDGDTVASYYTLSSDGVVPGASSGAVSIAWDISHSGDDY